MDTIIQGDALTILKTLPDQCVQTCVTSPPYWGLRDYGVAGQLGLEPTPEVYITRMVEVFRQVYRILRYDGTLWLNLGDCYATGGKGGSKKQNTNVGSIDGNVRRSSQPPQGLKQKDIVGIPWRVAFALQADGWFLRQDIIWHKPNPMPESAADRCTKAHEYIFLFSKSAQYYFNHEAIRERAAYDGRGDTLMKGSQKYKSRALPGQAEHVPASRRHERWQRGRNDEYLRSKRSVWTVPTRPYKGAHFATFPPDLIRPCILAGAPTQHTVLDPFMGSGTTALVAKQLHRHYLGIELNPTYIELARERLGETRLADVA